LNTPSYVQCNVWANFLQVAGYVTQMKTCRWACIMDLSN